MGMTIYRPPMVFFRCWSTWGMVCGYFFVFFYRLFSPSNFKNKPQISFLSGPHSRPLSFTLCHILLHLFPPLSKLLVSSSFSLSSCALTLSIHSSRLSSQFVPLLSFIPSLSPPAGSNHLAQSDTMVVIGCPLPQIRSQLALGVLWRLPITPHPTDQGLTPERVEDRQEGKGERLILFIYCGFSSRQPQPLPHPRRRLHFTTVIVVIHRLKAL